MKFCNFYEREGDNAGMVRVGILDDGLVKPIQPLLPQHNWMEEAYGRPQGLGFDFIQNTVLDLGEWQRALLNLTPDQLADAAGFNPDALGFLPPVFPICSLRDGYAFEEHVRNARARRGLEIAPEWFQGPVFYFSNPNALLGHGEDVPAPLGGSWLDYELEVAAVIGQQGSNIPVEDAANFIAGYTIFNDWSLRDAQRREMAVGLGPAKGKDFASSLGPYLVTPDELEDRRDGKGYNLSMVARVNGREVSRNNWNTMHYSFAEIISHASTNVTLFPGDVIGSGTCGRGCLLELGTKLDDGSAVGTGADGWLGAGDVVELEVERLGILRSKVVSGTALLEEVEKY